VPGLAPVEVNTNLIFHGPRGITPGLGLFKPGPSTLVRRGSGVSAHDLPSSRSRL
jgi:hypothetical protein